MKRGIEAADCHLPEVNSAFPSSGSVTRGHAAAVRADALTERAD